jgi:hypothetical protein
MEDEDYFKFYDDVLIDGAEQILFRDTAIAIASDTDGHLDLDADTSIDFQIGTTEQIILTDGTLAPTTDDDITLGASDKRFKSLYLMPTSLYLGTSHITQDSYARNEVNGLLT